ncbi:MAG: chemotaxis response regulator protein-glutamate methylesterase [Alphaproteobacteria bacterium]|nr:chemotaxis response regulator protein-glutamate methylesterase [Alphaproteobacteria bacterium]
MTTEGAPGATNAKSGPAGPLRVMVVDDSAIIRGLIARSLEADSEIEVVSSVSNGELAVKAAARHQLDVVVLDIEMPVMDGLTALPKLLEIDPGLQIIMASTLTLRNADISMKALSMGAADYVPKPSSTSGAHGASEFRRDLTEKVKALGLVARQKIGAEAPSRRTDPAQIRGRTAISAPPLVKAPAAKIPLRQAVTTLCPEIILIGSSTGGPQALFTVFEHLRDRLEVPILITQHMPPTFTTILAEHLNRLVEGRCAEGVDGEPVQKERIYLAPGDHHMVLAEEEGRKIIRINQDPPENFCRPAVDPMFRSVAALYGSRVLAVVLTGMGSDGLRGGREIIESGGVMIAQDEASSVVWGMPGAVATDGLCSAVLPLPEIGPAIMRKAAGGRS